VQAIQKTQEIVIMKRNIVEIEEAKCTGCGLCVSACHEGALQLIDGKAKLVTDSYCDGLGACLPACPADAIRIVEREADAFDEAGVEAARQKGAPAAAPLPSPAPAKRACGCPGSLARSIAHPAAAAQPPVASGGAAAVSNITSWPIQIKLVPVNAPYFHNASLLIAADCTAFASADFNARFMKGRVTLIGCPKLDDGDYSEKLTAILKANDIAKVTVVRMEVPCCAGIVNAVKQALVNSGKMIPWQAVTIGVDGSIIDA
jgi:ferredoxin